MTDDLDRQAKRTIIIAAMRLFPGGRANALRWGYETFAPRLTCRKASGGVIFCAEAP